jgi:septal ring factor EnvC (AmiA/AmiB activator)
VINDEEKKNDATFNDLTSNCNSSEGSVNSAMNKLINDINDSTKNFNDWKATLTASAKEITKAEGDIKATGIKLNENKKSIDQQLEDFKLVATETDQKLNVVKTLRDIITDELLNNAHGHSFVQLNKFTDKLNELKGMLNSETDSLYTPLVSVLLELASEQNFTDQTIMKKILENINNLESNLRTFRQQKESGLNSELKNLKSTGINLGKIINAYENMRAQSFSKKIDAQHYIHFYTNEITHFNAEKARKTDELGLLQKICNFEKNAHAKDKQSLQDFKTKVVPFIVEQIQRLQH